MELKGRVAMVTGGAQGIGRGITEALLDRGAKVLFCDVNADNGRNTERQLQTKYESDDVIFAQCDVTDTKQFAATFQQAVSRFGAVDIMVNNAGILDERIPERMFQINTMGSIHGCELAREHMRRDRGGHGGVIVNVVSAGGLSPYHFCPNYCAFKHAVIGYTTSWAKHPDTPAMGLRWCCLCPYDVNTSMLRDLQPGQMLDLERLSQDKSKKLEVEDVAAAFLRLVADSDNNGCLMTVEVDGGARYWKRQLVDPLGQADPVTVD